MPGSKEEEKKVIHAAMHIIENGEDLARAEFWEGEEMRSRVELLLSQYAKQYEDSMNVLRHAGLLEGNKLPAFEKVMNTFTPEKLELASKFQEPKLRLVPAKFGALIQAIDSHKMKGQKDTYVNKEIFGDPDPESSSGDSGDLGSEKIIWRPVIVESAQEMEVKEGDNKDEKLKKRIEKRQAERKDTLLKGIDRDIYAMIMLESIIKGQPIDQLGCTILDGDDALDFSLSSKVPMARYFKDDKENEVAFYGTPSRDKNSFARFRSVIEGDGLIF